MRNKIAIISFSTLPVYYNMGCALLESITKLGVNCNSILSKELLKEDKNNKDLNILHIATPKRPTPSLDSIKLFYKNKKTILNYIKDNNIKYVLFISKHIWNFLLIKDFKKMNIKIYHIFHDPVGHNGDSISKGVYIYNRILSKKLNGIFVLSKKSFDDTIKYLKPKCKVFQIPFADRKWRDLNLSTTKHNNLLLFGRLNNYKGLEYIPDLADQLFKLDSNIKITVAGKASDDLNPDILKKIGTKTNVIINNNFIPEQQIDNYYDHADLCLVLHTSITQSGVILDAYRHSKTIACFNIDGISDFVNNQFALIIEPFDTHQMASNIIKLLNNMHLLQEKSKMAWEFGKSNFSIDSTANLILTCINNDFGD